MDFNLLDLYKHLDNGGVYYEKDKKFIAELYSTMGPYLFYKLVDIINMRLRRNLRVEDIENLFDGYQKYIKLGCKNLTFTEHDTIIVKDGNDYWCFLEHEYEQYKKYNYNLYKGVVKNLKYPESIPDKSIELNVEAKKLLYEWIQRGFTFGHIFFGIPYEIMMEYKSTVSKELKGKKLYRGISFDSDEKYAKYIQKNKCFESNYCQNVTYDTYTSWSKSINSARQFSSKNTRSIILESVFELDEIIIDFGKMKDDIEFEVLVAPFKNKKVKIYEDNFIKVQDDMTPDEVSLYNETEDSFNWSISRMIEAFIRLIKRFGRNDQYVNFASWTIIRRINDIMHHKYSYNYDDLEEYLEDADFEEDFFKGLVIFLQRSPPYDKAFFEKLIGIRNDVDELAIIFLRNIVEKVENENN